MSLAGKLRDALLDAARDLPEDTARMAVHAATALQGAADKDAATFIDHLFRGSAAAGALQQLPPVPGPAPEPEPEPAEPEPAAPPVPRARARARTQ